MEHCTGRAVGWLDSFLKVCEHAYGLQQTAQRVGGVEEEVERGRLARALLGRASSLSPSPPGRYSTPRDAQAALSHPQPTRLAPPVAQLAPPRLVPISPAPPRRALATRPTMAAATPLQALSSAQDLRTRFDLFGGAEELPPSLRQRPAPSPADMHRSASSSTATASSTSASASDSDEPDTRATTPGPDDHSSSSSSSPPFKLAGEQWAPRTVVPPQDHSDFLWQMNEEPHRSRRMAIMKAHPEVRPLLPCRSRSRGGCNSLSFRTY